MYLHTNYEYLSFSMRSFDLYEEYGIWDPNCIDINIVNIPQTVA